MTLPATRVLTILAMRNQGRTYKAIGSSVGVSTQRVGQILKSEGQAGRFICQRCQGRTIRFPLCPVCAKPKRTVRVGYFVCAKCGQPFTLAGQSLSMQRGNIKRGTSRNAWCPECRAQRQHGPFAGICYHCGRAIVRTGRAAHTARYNVRHGGHVKCTRSRGPCTAEPVVT